MEMGNEELKKKLMLEEMMTTVSDEELQNSANGMYRIYSTFKQAGFTPKQSFELVKAMIQEALKPRLESRP